MLLDGFIELMRSAAAALDCSLHRRQITPAREKLLPPAVAGQSRSTISPKLAIDKVY
jgi:hypothetical protein